MLSPVSNASRPRSYSTLYNLVALVAPVCLLAAGSLELAKSGDNHSKFGLVIATIVMAAFLWLPLLLRVDWLALSILIPLGTLVVPAAVHLAYLKQGKSESLFACGIADVVLAGLVIL